MAEYNIPYLERSREVLHLFEPINWADIFTDSLNH